jgi:hypothetical protein
MEVGRLQVAPNRDTLGWDMGCRDIAHFLMAREEVIGSHRLNRQEIVADLAAVADIVAGQVASAGSHPQTGQAFPARCCPHLSGGLAKVDLDRNDSCPSPDCY